MLAVGSIGEQVKTRLEVAEEERGTQEVRRHAIKFLSLLVGNYCILISKLCFVKLSSKLQYDSEDSAHVYAEGHLVCSQVSDAQEVVLPSGVSYIDLRKGGGSRPVKGYLAVIDFT